MPNKAVRGRSARSTIQLNSQAHLNSQREFSKRESIYQINQELQKWNQLSSESKQHTAQDVGTQSPSPDREEQNKITKTKRILIK